MSRPDRRWRGKIIERIVAPSIALLLLAGPLQARQQGAPPGSDSSLLTINVDLQPIQ